MMGSVTVPGNIFSGARVSAALLLAALTTASATASAVIVWEGEIVDHWPEEPAKPFALAEVGNIHRYPSPKGEIWGLTVLVDFSDQSPAFTKDEVEEWLNLNGFDRFDCNGSVRDYYFDVSNGQVDFQNDVFGYYRAAHPKSYYEDGSGYGRAGELVDEVIDWVDDQVDFSRYDNDGDGYTEAISIVYAGFGEEWGQGLWPHAGGYNGERDAVSIGRYMMTDLKEWFGLYTFAHEIGHMLFGWPDLYGFGNYCIMGNGASQANPPGINDLYRADQGWIPIVDVTADTNTIYQAVANGAGYRYLNPERDEEAFFWSNVRSQGRFDTIEGDGLLLLHFDEEIGFNNPPNPLSLAVVQADGKKDLDQTTWPSPGSDAEDYFHAAGVHEFSVETHETARWNDGSESGLRIYDVGPISDSVEFKVGYGEPVVDPGSAGSAGTGGSTGNGGGAGSGGTGGEAGTSTPPPGQAGVSGGGAAGSAGSSPLAGSGGAALTPPPGDSDQAESSCACRVPARPRNTPLAWLATALLGLSLCMRRRRRALNESVTGIRGW